MALRTCGCLELCWWAFFLANPRGNPPFQGPNLSGTETHKRKGTAQLDALQVPIQAHQSALGKQLSETTLLHGEVAAGLQKQNSVFLYFVAWIGGSEVRGWFPIF